MLKRYDMDENVIIYENDCSGQWVKYEDVEPLIKLAELLRWIGGVQEDEA